MLWGIEVDGVVREGFYTEESPLLEIAHETIEDEGAKRVVMVCEDGTGFELEKTDEGFKLTYTDDYWG